MIGSPYCTHANIELFPLLIIIIIIFDTLNYLLIDLICFHYFSICTAFHFRHPRYTFLLFVFRGFSARFKFRTVSYYMVKHDNAATKKSERKKNLILI